jgi:hypothetical protein
MAVSRDRKGRRVRASAELPLLLELYASKTVCAWPVPLGNSLDESK